MSNQINDGGPAFPAQDWQAKGNHHPGMTLRDWFAGQALGWVAALLVAGVVLLVLSGLLLALRRRSSSEA